MVYREDFERVTAKHTGSWSLTHLNRPKSPVRIIDGHTSVYVGRLITEAPGGTAIVYHDEDRLNLRSDNLGLTRGCGGRDRKRSLAPLFVSTRTRGGRRA